MKRTLSLALSLCFAAFAMAGADFRSVGSLPGGNGASALGVSGDGNWVVGLSNSSSGIQAFRWSLTLGIEGLGDLDGGAFSSVAYGVSRNGRVVVGSGTRDGYSEAFRWTTTGGMMGLGDLWPVEPYASSVAYGVSGDGLTVAGTSDVEDGVRAFRWRSGEGMLAIAGYPGDVTQFSTQGAAVSADGNWVVGVGDNLFSQMAFRWSGSGPIEGIGYLPDGSFSTATACSSDGSVVVGFGDDLTGLRAFRYVAGGSMLPLPELGAQYGDSSANGVSGDGTIVVGSTNGPQGEVATIWTQATGTQNLKTVLETTYGLNLTGWVLNSATGISADGTVVVGTGVQGGQPRGWVARMPKAGTVEAAVNLLDFGGDPELQTVAVELRTPGSSTPVESHSIPIDSIGMIRFVTALRGNYDLAIKGSHWLRSVHPVAITNSSVTAAPFNLRNGDIDGDNEVGIADYAVLSSAYNSAPGDLNWSASADLNGDEAVDIGDYSILSANYGLLGDD
ncbi:MAG: hypothetical protein K1X67_04525 [Fimbriimonadaceae bacterium]|nr:hypothetical protein [Fimbriimonadaceae bacterium]